MHGEIEPELKYCPACGDEYRQEIETCAACEVELLTGPAMQAMLDGNRLVNKGNRSVEIQPDESLVTVRKAQVREIKQLQHYLLERGFPSLACREEGSCARGCRGVELLLQVRMSDTSDVVAVLEEEHRHSTGLTDEENRYSEAVYSRHDPEATCPACGCRFPTTLTACSDCGLSFS